MILVTILEDDNNNRCRNLKHTLRINWTAVQHYKIQKTIKFDLCTFLSILFEFLKKWDYRSVAYSTNILQYICLDFIIITS